MCLFFKRILLVNALLLYTANCFAQNNSEIFYYKFNDSNGLFHINQKLIVNGRLTDIKNNIRNLLNIIQNEYDLKIQIEYSVFKDNKGSEIYGVIINLYSTNNINEYFKALAHRPILFDSINLNILQPLAANWKIVYILYKYNDNFISDMPTEIVIPLVVTKEMLDLKFLFGQD